MDVEKRGKNKAFSAAESIKAAASKKGFDSPSITMLRDLFLKGSIRKLGFELRQDLAMNDRLQCRYRIERYYIEIDRRH